MQIFGCAFCLIFVLAAVHSQGITEIGNGKPSTQSSTAHHGLAKYGNDGNTTQDNSVKLCTHTANEQGPWWQVDLQEEYNVNKVVIYNRRWNGDRLSNFVVKVGSSESNMQICASFPGTSKNSEIIHLSCLTSGRYLKIEMLGANFLTLCEVQIYGSAKGPKDVFSSLPHTKTLTLLSQGKPARQSSTYTASHSCPASNAVDGNTNGDWEQKSCAGTNFKSPATGYHWWTVDLGNFYRIHRIQIFNRIGSTRIQGLEVFVGAHFSNAGANITSSACMQRVAHYPNLADIQKNILTIDLNDQKIARHIILKKTDSTSALITCEVKVFGELQKAGYFNAVEYIPLPSSCYPDNEKINTRVSIENHMECGKQCLRENTPCASFTFKQATNNCSTFKGNTGEWDRKFF